MRAPGPLPGSSREQGRPSSARGTTARCAFGIAAEPYAPFSYKTPSGKWEGFEPDLARALCEEMKAKCKIAEIAWDGIIPALLAHKIDVIFTSMSITAERKKTVAFTIPYYDTPTAVTAPAHLPECPDRRPERG